MSDNDSYSPELLDMLQPGKKVRVFYGEGNINNQLRHIRAIVDGDYIVYRIWSRRRGYWLYRVEWAYGFQLLFNGGRLSKAA